jgi:hypothetical protein
MKNTGQMYGLITVILLGSLCLSACGAGTPEPTPTMSIEMIQTSAVSIFVAGLTMTAARMSTQTPTNTPTFTPSTTPTIATPVGPGAPTASCYGLTGITDVTIPDNTPMLPGQAFIKTWRVKNSGTCTWEAGFRFVFLSGDSMGGTALVLDKAVSPGAEIDLSVSMVAPTDKTGTVRGNWRLSTATGLLFGDEQYVIIVLGGATGTPTATPTDTPMLEPTATVSQ